MKVNIGKFIFVVFVLFQINGCASNDKVSLSDFTSDDIKTYKTVNVYARYSDNTKTDVFVEKGDLYSFIVTGGISIRRWKPVSLTWDGESPLEFLGATIGNKSNNFPPINATTEARSNGEIGLYIKEGRFDFEKGKSETPYVYEDNTGKFEVTIIVWKTKNLDNIADYFKRLAIQNPENEPISAMHDQAIHLKSVL